MTGGRVRTGPIAGNQAKIDELEYFIASIGGYLYGTEGEDFRRLRQYVPVTRNLSALLDLASVDGRRDVSEDLRFLHVELEARARASRPTPDLRAPSTVFHFRRYIDLVDHPERLIEAVEPRRRLEVASLVTAGTHKLAPTLSKVSALAWLSVVGLPDLERELGATAKAVLELPELPPSTGLDRLLAAAKLSPALDTYYRAAYKTLAEEYRGQLARLAVRTAPLA